MKLITAIVRTSAIDSVQQALNTISVGGMSVTEVRGYGRQKGHSEIYRGAEYDVTFQPKLKVEIAVQQDQVEQIIETIMDAARTGRVGDGKIFVSDLERVIRIRNGEEEYCAV